MPPADPPVPAMHTVARAAALLFTAGQTTERAVLAAQDLARASGFHAVLFPRWGEIVVGDRDRPGVFEIVPAAPLGVDMGKVAAATTLVGRARAGEASVDAVAAALERIEREAPASTARFAAMAALGAAALGVIFGDLDGFSLALIAVSAGLGALVRRGLARLAGNPFVQPLCAALLAGLVGAFSADLAVGGTRRLIALCPCMVLVPGPHVLNGALDLARGRIALALSRLGYAATIVLVICAALLLGLAAGGGGIPPAAPALRVPLAADVLAAGVAVAAYGSFFSMPWRTLPIPMVVGMAAHALRWVATTGLGGSAELGAFVASLLVGGIASPVSDRLDLPFAALGFSAVVSLMPGYFLFETAGGMLDLVSKRDASPASLVDITVNGATALFIVLAITFGLVLPRLLIGRRVEAAIPDRKTGS